MSELTHGSEVRPGKAFIALICDIDDITLRAQDNGQTLTDKEAEKAYQYARRKLDDMLMNSFWDCIDDIIDGAKSS